MLCSMKQRVGKNNATKKKKKSIEATKKRIPREVKIKTKNLKSEVIAL